MNLHIRDFKASDLTALLALNESAVPEVSSLSENAFRILAGQACYLKIAMIGDKPAGFLLALAPGQDYQSLNYKWFSERYNDFVYIDRVIVAAEFRGQGIGKALYRDIEEFATGSAKALAAEVNLAPPNPDSIAFHHKSGFEEVGQQNTEGGKKRVSLLIKCLGAVSCRKVA